ncbi:MAG: bifunctional folylpolyglutamate synthase/dihydrofolate synthase [FCB group bacterium]|nr:bifunctional folylpolyglutamate synthase/dihydrofolate synthase [FCB group bacterium]
MPQHSYASAEKFILSREFFGMKLGLENIKHFLSSVGSPQTKYETIHIAGTNGKGSTAAMLEAVLRAQGYKTGLFTSPHLVSLRERIRVNGKMIPKPAVINFIDKYRQLLVRRKLSFFELLTAMALNYFARVNVEVAVIETGLGGRLDATNVLKPILTITTDISRDHIEILGNSIQKITREKAGIIKEKTPHLIGLLPKTAEEVIRRRCLRMKAPFYKLNRNDFYGNSQEMKLNFNYNGLNIKNLPLSLIGTHQLKNAALVLKALSLINQNGFLVSPKAIYFGIAHTSWPGRFQVVEYKNKPIHIFDVSHNTAGVKSFVESFRWKYPRRKAFIITGFVKRKEHQKIYNSLKAISLLYALVPLATKRSSDLFELIRDIDFHGVPFVKFGSLKTAYLKLLKICSPDDILIIIGSHFLVGEFFEKFKI